MRGDADRSLRHHAGETWQHLDKSLPNIQIAGRAVNVDDAWAVTTEGSSGVRIVPASDIVASYRLIDVGKRPGAD